MGQGPLSAEELDAAVRRFKKAIVERALGGESTHHLGYPPGGVKPEDVANHRTGTSPKTVLTEDGPLAIEVPRAFEPRLIPTHARRLAGFDDKILALYARGMTVREIQAFLAEMSVYPRTTLQTCIVHLIRRSLDFASARDRAPGGRASSHLHGREWRSRRGGARRVRALPLGDPWSRRGDVPGRRSSRFFAFPPAVRRVIDTTNSSKA